jgi:hypothetical protein
LQVVHTVAPESQVATAATVQTGTSSPSDVHANDEQMQVWAKAYMQHFCPDDKLGHSSTATPSAGRPDEPARPQSQIPAEPELVQP